MAIKRDIFNGVQKHKFKTKEEKTDRAREELKDLEDLPLVGGLFKGLEKFIDLAGRVEEAGGGIERKGEIKGLGGKTKGIYGFSIRTGIGERPKIQTFGNIRPVKEKAKPPYQNPARKQASYGTGKFGTGQAKIKITEEREPIVDVFDEKDHILVIIELPGMGKESIKLTLKGDILTLKAHSAGHSTLRVSDSMSSRQAGSEKRKYYKEILLPAEVDIRTKKVSYRNGLLEVKIKKLRKKK
ncbi:MAG: Hsp20/alpha crystallin family protein [Candidatus Doudnabacteria bacterium]